MRIHGFQPSFRAKENPSLGVVKELSVEQVLANYMWVILAIVYLIVALPAVRISASRLHFVDPFSYDAATENII